MPLLNCDTAVTKRKRCAGALKRTDSPMDETTVEVCPISLDETPSVYPLSLVESCCLSKFLLKNLPASFTAPALLGSLLDYSSLSVRLLTVIPSVVAPTLLDSLLGNPCRPQADRSSELSIFKASLISQCCTSLTCLCGVVKEFCWRPSIFQTVPLPCLSVDINICGSSCFITSSAAGLVFDLLRALHGVCYALSTFHVDGLLPMQLSCHLCIQSAPPA